MPLYLDDEQLMLQDTARAFFGDNAPVAHMRALRDNDDPAGLSRELWSGSGDMGFPAILIAEADGGLGLGHVEAGIVQEEIGRNLVPSPFLGTAIGAATALAGAAPALKAQWLASIAQGQAIAALAFDEGAKHAPEKTALAAERAGDGFRLTGTKRFVPHAHVADLWIVSARLDGKLALFLVTPGAQGVSLRTATLADASLVSDIDLAGVEVSAEALLGGEDLHEAVLAAARTGAAAELVGLATAAMERTFTYLRDRKQFGTEIGSFQALQHRAAILHAEVDMAQAAVRKACQALDQNDPECNRHAMVAKAAAALTATLAVQEGVQMHGGIGMTDEHDIGLYMKRARTLAELHGDANYLANRIAINNGY